MFTIGADIEVFGRKPDKGSFIALCGKIGGTKQRPLQVEGLPPGFMVQEDNVSLEYNIPICKSKDQFVSSVKTMRDFCHVKLKSLNLELSEVSSVSFPVEELVHPKALEFGCEPDYNAWTKTENERPFNEDRTLRTCGGHVHVGTSNVDMVAGIRSMDLFLGVPSILLDNSPESRRRRALYGKQGAMRPKPYGFEYRVLSNFWMFQDSLVAWVYTNTKAALDNHKLINNKALSKKIQRCISEGDSVLAEEIIKEVGILLPGDEPLPNKKEDFKINEDFLKAMAANWQVLPVRARNV